MISAEDSILGRKGLWLYSGTIGSGFSSLQLLAWLWAGESSLSVSVLAYEVSGGCQPLRARPNTASVPDG